ncbi:TPA: hypothetical protein DDW69_03055 [candidate division CPR2 bacterium]|uniref:Acyltransferase 3 domain-containing protein n=1 Tax=candidate division CPR2 bacterium GW2011_GWC1_41_48 TaxID=1618344 RepID=A0A0G0WAP9_UNCC2|nr:MAG: hypothetical protein UT47_C0003G0193 [candidate division CPR2 bacterium GW2011_GWC2_39_35]KKR29224.1 MAG: hypothetical protein UT60_C0005G0029 [candidate division CPR2 bacterium GW2011_GWD2_39_7]KKS09132.1 MAG: hypothetical protein UU65_C0003G0187 [candidate division CPR2 bacterium GW2011_GWC1_41_48]HBG81796.1 hypothetical protein [candidate division CPR2 bacterium]HCM00032.1 hypothetical protein [candidate division CPR2 bacterium]
MSQSGRRFFLFDLLRGIAVLLMILAHTVYFFHNSTSPFLLSLEKIGNTVCFVAFLLISGAVSYIVYFRDEESWHLDKKRIIKRLTMLLVSYYVLAFFVMAGQILTSYGLWKWGVILNILTFRTLPSYTEYIPPFILFSFLIAFFPKYFKEMARSIPLAFAISACFYFAGTTLFRLPMFQFLVPWKAFFVGHPGYYRFPIFQYFPIFILGISWGYRLITADILSKKEQILKKFLVFFGLLAAAIAVLSFGLTKNLSLFSLRWPPSIPFLLTGILFTFFASVLLYKTAQLKKIPILRDFLLVLGQNSYALFWTHIFLLQLYEMSGGTKVGSVVIFIFLFALTIVLSLALATFIPFNFKFTLNFIKGSREDQEDAVKSEAIYRLGEEVYKESKLEIKHLKNFFFLKSDGSLKKKRLIKKRHALFASLILLLVSFMVVPSAMEEVRESVKSAQITGWWSDEYAFNRPLIVKNKESFSDITKGQILKFSLDHQKLVKEKKSLPNGKDVRIVFWNGGSFEEAEFSLQNGWNLSNTTIKFKNPKSIPAGQEIKDLYLYYGNAVSKDVPASNMAGEWRYGYETAVGDEAHYPTILETDRLWILKSDKVAGVSTLNVSVKTASELTDPQTKVEVLKTEIEGSLEKSDANILEGVIDVGDLKPGQYQIQATIKDGGQTYKSQKHGFYVSYPLYVTWTQDWEGIDVSQVYLNAMANIADNHGLSMTHLFNPRIYVSSMPQDRQDYLTDWVKQREKVKDEEVGLHLHMYYDFIKDAGVVPKNSPNWGDSGDGYGSLTSNYNEAEMVKILERALWWFEKKGLLKPVSFRAGGWFANEETLKSLEKVGIKLDSSGRTSYSFYSEKGPWNLSKTAAPYKPSRTDQNKTSDDALDVWEVPNNGADSYWFSAKDMISRFDENYKGGILTDKKQVTYLSHPHWFNRAEQDKVNEVFNHVDQFKYEKDLGPVIYVTLRDIYNDWLKEN